MSPHEFFRRSIDVLGAGRVRVVLGFQSTSSVHRIARHPQDDSDPDGTGAHSPAERMDLLRDALAAYPEGRALLAEWHQRETAEHERRLDLVRRPAVCPDTLLAQMGTVVREVSEWMAVCRPERLDLAGRKRLHKEAGDVLAAMRDFMGTLAVDEAGEPEIEQLRRRAG